MRYCIRPYKCAPPTENHILKQLSYEARFLKRMREQFSTLSSVAVPSSGGVAFRIVMAMKPRYAGEARAALLAVMTANRRPRIVIVVDPDIDVHDPCRSTGPAPSACSRRAT
jgi:2,5-furandicarboxylate decarboxylase 1